MEQNMQALKAIMERRSVRSYKPDKVPDELIDKIVEAGLYAPSGMDRQPVIIIAITNKEMRDRLSRLNASILGSDKDPFYGAPAVLVVLSRKDAMTYIYDGALAMGNMMNAAAALGLGSCWIHRGKEEFESEEGKEILRSLGIEGDYEGIGNCIVGYAAEEPKASVRKPGRAYKIG